MKRSLALACAGAVLVGVAAGSSRATTQPGVLSLTRLVITDDRILFRSEDFMTRSGIPHYPRGTDVRYDIRNRGSRPYALNVLGSVTGTIAPGRQRTILVYWSYRGRYVFRARPNGPAMRVWVV